MCWVLECLLKDDNYPSGLQKLMREEPQLRLSETVLQQALTSSSNRVPSALTPSAARAVVAPAGCCI